MADVRAFPGLRYDAGRVGELAAVVAPPYDVIPEDQVAGYQDRSPWNVMFPTTVFNSSDTPDTVFNVVDFPAPLPPMIETTSPGNTSNVMPRKARAAP